MLFFLYLQAVNQGRVVDPNITKYSVKVLPVSRYSSHHPPQLVLLRKNEDLRLYKHATAKKLVILLNPFIPRERVYIDYRWCQLLLNSASL